MKELTTQNVEHLSHTLAREIMSWNEPIPDFKTRFPGRLESCLRTPFQTFGGKDIYRTLTDKASILFYLLNKNHPFQNGNKRIAVSSLLIFLFINNHWLDIPHEVLYRVAMDVAGSSPELKDGIIFGLNKIIKKYLIKVSV